MFITDIFFNGEALDMFTDKALRYTIQVNDIAEVKDRQATFTNSYDLPKTSRNVRILGGLGITSDTSPYPYQKPECQAHIDGFPLIVKGWINIKNTDEVYKIYLYSGIIEFFKTIENKTLGADLDLSEINHTKNVANVIASFENANYKYLITDYNGLTHYSDGSSSVINIDYLVPSVSFAYLWQKIHAAFNFTYSGTVFDSSRFNNLYITFSKPVPTISNEELKKTATGSQSVGTVNVNTGDINNFYRQLNSGALDANKTFTIPEDGNYKIVFTANINFTFENGNDISYYASVNQESVPFSQRVNPTLLGTFPHINQSVKTESIINTTLVAGDVISFYSFMMLSNGVVNWNTAFDIKIYRLEGGSASFTDDLKDFKITDFIKEALNLFGLTPFTDEHSRNIDYRLMAERVVTAEVVDWSDKFIERTDEKYVYNNFAQRNVFSYQYNDKESTYNNGSINVENINLEESKDAFKSKIYSPEKDLSLFFFGTGDNSPMPVFKLYDKNIKENGGTQTIEYKALDKRFHYLRAGTKTISTKIGSNILGQEQTISSLAIAVYDRLKWADVLNDFYFEYNRIINDARLHDISLYLYPADLLLLDLKKLYYFEQEQQYYILNKLQYDGKEVAKGEFVRVRRDIPQAVIPVDPVDPLDYFIQAVWYVDNVTTPKVGDETQIEVALSTHIFPVDDPLVSFEWQADYGAGFTNLGVVTNVAMVNLLVGNNFFRIKATTSKGYTVFSNALFYTRRAYECRNYRVTWILSVDYPEPSAQFTAQYISCESGKLAFDLITLFPGNSLTREYCAKVNTMEAFGSQSIEDLGEC